MGRKIKVYVGMRELHDLFTSDSDIMELFLREYGRGETLDTFFPEKQYDCSSSGDSKEEQQFCFYNLSPCALREFLSSLSEEIEGNYEVRNSANGGFIMGRSYGDLMLAV
ncbi:MAG: hypothetical protein AABW80_01835 [Nanoarchaeota archaeon]